MNLPGVSSLPLLVVSTSSSSSISASSSGAGLDVTFDSLGTGFLAVFLGAGLAAAALVVVTFLAGFLVTFDGFAGAGTEVRDAVVRFTPTLAGDVTAVAALVLRPAIVDPSILYGRIVCRKGKVAMYC